MQPQRKAIATVAALALSATSCAGGGGGEAAGDMVTTVPAASAPSTVAVDGAASDEPVEVSAQPDAGGSDAELLGMASTPRLGVASTQVTVTGGALPAEVADAIASNGGELVDTAEWDARYGLAGLPSVTGPGVRLVGAEMLSRRVDTGWSHDEALQWLLMSSAELDAVLDAVASAAGVTSQPASLLEQPEPGADCVERVYRVDVEWRIGGCSYDAYDEMLAVSVQRIGVWQDPPRLLDASIVPVVDGIDAQVEWAELKLTSPDAAGNTLTIQVAATVADAEVRIVELADGPLAGWTPRPGTTPSFVSPNGGTWFAFGGNVEYRWGGRW